MKSELGTATRVGDHEIVTGFLPAMALAPGATRTTPHAVAQLQT
jgi:hypothetical protein